MSLYEARHLSNFGHDVKLIIPFKSRKQMHDQLNQYAANNLQSLLAPEEGFEIEALYLDEGVSLRSSDALIWQTTDTQDWAKIYPVAIANSRIVSKNFPKIVCGLPAPLSQHSRAQMAAFDLLAFALKEDYHAVWQYPEYANANQHKFTYVQRGADPSLLHAKDKSSSPVIAIDTPNTRDTVGIEHLIEPLKRLKCMFPDLQVMTLGGEPLDLSFAHKLQYMSYDKMYQKFLNPAWIYCVVDYSQSPAHIKGAIHNEDRAWDAKAIYEVQTIEAQMAGCVVAGFSKNIIPELVEPSHSLLWDDFASADTITNSLQSVLECQASMAGQIRSRAERHFDWKTAMLGWENALLNLSDNGYDRNKQTFKSTSTLEGTRHISPSDTGKSMVSIPAALNPDEKQLLYTLVHPCRRFVEFGCGGSTKIAALSGVDHIESIETDIDWIKNLEQDSALVSEVESGRLRFHHIDIGETKEWGYPVELDPQRCVRYTKVPWTAFPLDDVDVVLVDGRFRVATALEAALRTQNHCLIIVDDYLDRPHFSVLEEHLDVVVKASRMVVFAKGDKWLRSNAFETLDAYRLDPR